MALRVASENVARQQLGGQVRLVQGCWAESILGLFDGIIANPPYIPSAEVDLLPRDVRQEPRLSLDGGLDGRGDLEHIAQESARLLGPGGLLALECGEEQAGELMDAAHAWPWLRELEAVQDLAGRPRGLLAVRCGGTEPAEINGS
jgi:release factor glutamine methyltransferase